MSIDSAQQGTKDVQEAVKQPTTGDRLQTASHEISNARNSFKDPKDYADFMTNFAAGASQQKDLLPALELVNPDMHRESQLLKDMTADDNKLYKLLDTYADKDSDRAGANPDGQIGKADVDAFLKDATDPTKKDSDAAKLLAAHPELQQLLQDQVKQSGTFDATRLLNDLGYNNDMNAFKKAHEGQQNATVEMKDAQGRVETVIEPNGTATGFHYDSNNKIDAMNVSDASGHNWSYHRGPNGKFVDQNNNPVPVEAPSVAEDGTYSFYSPVDGNDRQVTKHSLDPKTGQWSAEQVDRSQMPQGAGDNPQQPGQGKPYQVQDGDNLTNIARQALGKGADYDGPEVAAAIAAIAKVNNIDNPDVILTGSTLNIPGDLTGGANAAVPEGNAGMAPAVAPEGDPGNLPAPAAPPDAYNNYGEPANQ